MKLNQKTILTDIDGVMLDWIGGFENYMNETYCLSTVDASSYALDARFGIETTDGGYSYIKEFNHSDLIGKLQPERDAVEYVSKLVNDGYKFIAITSLSKNDSSCQARVENLKNVFGDDVFEDYHFLEIGEHKRDALARFAGTDLPWIEDLPKNAMDGYDIGLDTYLVRHTYNAEFYHRGLTFVDGWADIYSNLGW